MPDNGHYSRILLQKYEINCIIKDVVNSFLLTISLVKSGVRKMCEQRKETARRAGAGGFTLVELLVVISIMALLMSMILPSLNRAREAGQRVVCSSNMRQLTLGWYMYSTDNDDRLCSADTLWNDPGNNWVADGLMMPGNNIGGTEEAIKNGILWWPYMGRSFDVYRCKSDSSELLRSYSLSRTMNGDPANIRPYRTLGEITRRAEKMVFTDASSRMRWIDGSFCPVLDMEATPPEWFLSDSRNITARHGDGCIISLADLHCEYWKWSDPRTIRLANWEIHPTDASGGNRDLERMVSLLKGIGQ
jgi:prepilin-type N-terminal cleavage/methylation domain-containing protein